VQDYVGVLLIGLLAWDILLRSALGTQGFYKDFKKQVYRGIRLVFKQKKNSFKEQNSFLIKYFSKNI